ncbi:hypothetical protein COCCADRAFT_7601 [Bipolaris zeicola 26-R-13]|uniref:MARVEL domain-containing protein n=1 Tax=Cochliobolus carbonum (strain 26-R-13) TaxID=930089 RepID=W6Y5F2_COCC2|nr:uncharacterized protein COCCADRAFT_7601 [Bipolaris zeicola 26-R-13]EUC30364.1 hypothetical protein COCCADRAFT_7601 [Bipolaris zeicola 26-R-13]
MATRKDRVKPTPYPFLWFHLPRSAQLVSSLVVAGIMSYFLRELSRDGYTLPWTFILLMVVSVLTIVALASTIVLHLYHGLNPGLNIAVNGSLGVLWIVSFGLLARWTSGTVAGVCDTSHWDSDTGVNICRQYKALFSFALLGLLATLLAVAVDVKVLKGARTRGVFQPVDGMAGERKGALDNSQDPEANPNPIAARTRQVRGGEGYALPEEQFEYDDLEYHGAAGEIRRRSLERRT